MPISFIVGILILHYIARMFYLHTQVDQQNFYGGLVSKLLRWVSVSLNSSVYLIFVISHINN